MELANQRLIDVTGGVNFRELGGYPTTSGQTVKWHRVIRTASLAALTDADQARLVNYGIRLDVDFRSNTEVAAAPDRIPAQITYRHLPVFKEDETDNSKSNEQIRNELGMTERTGHDEMLKVYRHMVMDSQSQAAYQAFFAALLTTGGTDEGLLFHCTAGKDRTGMGAALFLGALGVDQATIKQDYLMTNQLTKRQVQTRLNEARQAGLNAEMLDSLRSLITVSGDYFDTGLATIRENYGDLQTYLNQALAVSDHDLADLKTLYLDN